MPASCSSRPRRITHVLKKLCAEIGNLATESAQGLVPTRTTGTAGKNHYAGPSASRITSSSLRRRRRGLEVRQRDSVDHRHGDWPVTVYFPVTRTSVTGR